MSQNTPTMTPGARPTRTLHELTRDVTPRTGGLPGMLEMAPWGRPRRAGVERSGKSRSALLRRPDEVRSWWVPRDGGRRFFFIACLILVCLERRVRPLSCDGSRVVCGRPGVYLYYCRSVLDVHTACALQYVFRTTILFCGVERLYLLE